MGVASSWLSVNQVWCFFELLLMHAHFTELPTWKTHSANTQWWKEFQLHLGGAEGAVLPLQQTRKTLYVTMMPPTQISLCLILLSHGATPQNFVVRALGEDGSSTGNEVISISVQNNNTLNSVGDVNIDPGLIEDELVCNITQQGGPAGPGRDCKLPFTFNGVVSGAK